MNGVTNMKKLNYPFIKNKVTPVPMNVVGAMGLNIYKLSNFSSR
jgi:hypothetical protein